MLARRAQEHALTTTAVAGKQNLHADPARGALCVPSFCCVCKPRQGPYWALQAKGVIVLGHYADRELQALALPPCCVHLLCLRVSRA
jgi:hypothetical protein